LSLPFHKKQLFDKEGKQSSPTPETIAVVTNAQKVLKVNSRRNQREQADVNHTDLLELMMNEREGWDQIRSVLAQRLQ
jgi:hypothetical protein